MTVEAGEEIMEEERDEFPLGMRVLVVDDDPVCLRVLDVMLCKCKYHVTTTNQAVKALKMLRDNKDKFDLIITDVHMPDMDGFKLLELVGLEMDLPVIMLSANGDTKLVMKGITHGACDYLLKPVRMEELKNIWQHVIRKKKSGPREYNSSDNGMDEAGQGPNTSGSSEQKGNRKRKDQTEEEEDDTEENDNENENTSTQKRARVVWSVELHRKFMAAVNHLGINKAVPKRILDLMNVEGLTRENVASHLQKYRLFLKKVTTQEANFGAALGVRDSYPPLAVLDGYVDFHSLRSSSQLPAPQSFQQHGGRSRKDSTLFGQNVAPGMVQGGHFQNSSKPVNDLDRFHHVTGSYHGDLNPNMPAAADQLQQHKRMIYFPSSGLRSGGSSNPLGVITNNPLTLHPSHSSIGFSPVCSGPFEMNALPASHFSGTVRCNETLQNAFLSTSTASSLAMCSTGSSGFLQANNNPLGFPSNSAPAALTCHPVTGNAMAMLKGNSKDLNYLKFGGAHLRQAKHEHVHEPNIAFSSSLNTPLAGHSIVDTPPHSHRLNDVMFNKRTAANMNGQTDYSGLFPPQDTSTVDGQLMSRDLYALQSSTIQGLLGSSGYSDNELMNVIKSKQEDALFMDG